MRTATRSQFLATLLLVLCAACATGRNDGGEVARQLANRVGDVQVTNDGHQDIVLYLYRDANRYRLGRVSRMETARFRIPDSDRALSYQVQLVAEPVGGGRSFGTGTLTWRPGQSLRGRVARAYSSQQFVMVTH
jgi:hypothetical protein